MTWQGITAVRDQSGLTLTNFSAVDPDSGFNFASPVPEPETGVLMAIGMAALFLARRKEATNANLIGGDLGGGGNAWHQQLLFRPIFPYFRYRTPIAGLYLCSSYTHPGGGVHGMCGYNAAQAAARDLG